MSAAAISLITILIIVAFGAAIGFLAGVRRRMDLEQWTVAGRGFGAVLIFLLMAGEVYTTFAFLGASGWAYSRGGPILYVLAYLTLAYVVSFFFLPQLWEVGRRHGMQTQSDFFNARYGNKYLGAFVCIVGIVCFVPYVQLQITGVGIIVAVASFDGIGRTPAMAICVALLVAFVFANGVRAVAWVSVVKDALMIIAAISIGIGIPLLHFGGIGPHVCLLGARSAGTPDHAWRHHQPWACMVHLHGVAHFAGPLHVATCVWGCLYCEECRYAASQCRGHAPIHSHVGLYLLRRLCRCFDRARLDQWRPGALDSRPPEFSALVSGGGRRRRSPDCHGTRSDFYSERCYAVRQKICIDPSLHPG
jgi:Na+/proline symporter